LSDASLPIFDVADDGVSFFFAAALFLSEVGEYGIA
jgi:hypothetical protein